MRFFLLLLVLSPFFMWAQFNTARWVVLAENTPAYSSFNSPMPEFFLPYAYAFQSRGQRNGRVVLQKEGREFWIPQEFLVKIDFSPQKFSEDVVSFLPGYINNREFSFLYNGAVYLLNISNLNTPAIQKLADVPESSGAYFSLDNSLILVVGNSTQGLNLAFALPAQKKIVPLTILSGEVSLVTAEFSESLDYLALQISLNEKQKVLIYQVATGELIFTSDESESFQWAKNKLIIVKKNKVVSLSPKGKETVLYVSPGKKIQAQLAVSLGEALLDIDGSIYRLDGDGIEKTRYLSTERSVDGSLERSEKNNKIVFTYKNKPLRSLSGTKPLWDFIAFAGDNSLIYNKKSATEAITSLYYYDAEKNESFPYRWVEEPNQVLADGLAYEVVEDKDEIWLFFEYPGQQARMIQLSDILK